MDYVARVPISGRILGMGCIGKSHTLDHLDYTMELIYCLYFFHYDLVWCCILYVCLGCYKCLKKIYFYIIELLGVGIN